MSKRQNRPVWSPSQLNNTFYFVMSKLKGYTVTVNVTVIYARQIHNMNYIYSIKCDEDAFRRSERRISKVERKDFTVKVCIFLIWDVTFYEYFIIRILHQRNLFAMQLVAESDWYQLYEMSELHQAWNWKYCNLALNGLLVPNCRYSHFFKWSAIIFSNILLQNLLISLRKLLWSLFHQAWYFTGNVR